MTDVLCNHMDSDGGMDVRLSYGPDGELNITPAPPWEA